MHGRSRSKWVEGGAIALAIAGPSLFQKPLAQQTRQFFPVRREFPAPTTEPSAPADEERHGEPIAPLVDVGDDKSLQLVLARNLRILSRADTAGMDVITEKPWLATMRATQRRTSVLSESGPLNGCTATRGRTQAK